MFLHVHSGAHGFRIGTARIYETIDQFREALIYEYQKNGQSLHERLKYNWGVPKLYRIEFGGAPKLIKKDELKKLLLS